jgi:CRISPR-associated protein Csb2
VPKPVFGTEWTLLEIQGRARLTLREVLPLARAVRGALMHHSEQNPLPEVISGHVAGVPGEATSPTDRPHLAVVPLPSVGHRYADGLVRTVALVLPKEVDSHQRALVGRSVRHWLDDEGLLQLGPRGVVKVAPIDSLDAPVTAQPGRWCRAARRWVSVTPIALDRNPGNLVDENPNRRRAAQRAAEGIIAASCTNIGLPAPSHVSLNSDPMTAGSAPVRSFPRYSVKGGRLQRVLVHAEITFAGPVAGPLLLGAGRYLGYGLCTPLPSHAEGDGNG